MLSKLKDFSDRRDLPYHYLTRGISVAIFAAYFYKIGTPFVSQYVSNISSKFKSFQNQISECDGEKENMEMERKLMNDLFEKKIKKLSENGKEDYTDFGIKNKGEFADHMASCTTNFFFWFQRVTGINCSFIIQMIKLIRIMVPGFKTIEVLLLILHTCSLMARTFLSIYVAKLEGTVVKYIVKRDTVNFTAQLTKWILIAIPCTFTNSLIRFLECQLALAFRTRLVKYAYNLYFANNTYYSVSNLDTRLENADHSLTEDLICFTNHCAHLYSSATKPLLDLSLIGYTLYNMAQELGHNGSQTPMMAAVLFLSTHAILRFASPKFGSLVSEEARRKGFLRFVHARIISNAEEISFYKGEHIEHSIVQVAYNGLAQQMNIIYNQRLWYIMFEQFLMKYIWSATGMVMVAIPVMSGRVHIGSNSNSSSIDYNSANDISERTQYMTTAKNILISGGDAAERLMSSYKELIELTGYCKRVAKMFTVFEQVNNGKFIRPGQLIHVKNKELIKLQLDGSPVIRGIVYQVPDYIRLTNVNVVTPNLEVIIKDVNLTITRNMHLLINGPNGIGKSSLFRIMSSLWPLHSGTLERPSTRQLFYIPQRPYMSLGTLRDQLIYPDTISEMREKEITDQQLEEILELVQLKHIVVREGGWNARGDWRDMLSGGEKQRMALGRLFYHKPLFALLDECTSAVSMDVECKLYQTAKDYGITLITITHRPSLWKYHSHILQFDINGGYKLERLDTDQRLTLREEKEKLQSQLAEIPKYTLRLKELCSILGEDSALVNDNELVELPDELSDDKSDN